MAAPSTSANVRDVPAQQFIKALAEHLKKSGKIEPPKGAEYIKTGVHKELPPSDVDWFFVRTAAIARKIYIKPGSGVGALSRMFGGRYRRGVLPEKFSPAARGIIRRALQQLAGADIVGIKKGTKGRFLTRNGQRELDTIAAQLVPKPPKQPKQPKKPE